MKYSVLKKSLLLLAFSAAVQPSCVAAEDVDGLYSRLDRSPNKTIRLSCQTQVSDILGLLPEGNDLILQVKNSPYGNRHKAAARLSWERTLPVGERVSLDDAFPVFESLKSAIGDIPTPSFVTFEYSPDNGITFYDCDCDDRPGEAFKINLSSGWKKLDSIRFDIGRSGFDDRAGHRAFSSPARDPPHPPSPAKPSAVAASPRSGKIASDSGLAPGWFPTLPATSPAYFRPRQVAPL